MSEETTNERFPPEVPASQQTRAANAKEGFNKRLMVVGIGASAGGLQALQGFFDALPRDTGMAFVVVTHMAPDKESQLPAILQKHTAMPVRQVRDLTAIEADRVYVIPPGRRILVTDTHLDTEEFEEPRGRRTPVDDFFRSLADVHRDGAVAVILSGGGTDGAVGVKAIKEEGGVLLVQDPAEAAHDSMPRAAIATGVADVVLPVAELAQKLVAYQRNGARVPWDPEALTDSEVESLYRILSQVQVETGHDFSQYKRSTLLRRIHRRMQLHGYVSLEPYLGYLRHHADEARALFNDLLIGVTNFFRDKVAWEELAEQVIPALFEGKGQGDSVRVWSIGCSTGEEAYSLAILLLEHTATLEAPLSTAPSLQVFASDLDDGALEKGRQGVYPAAIEVDVSQERLERFFVKEGDHYRVKEELRDIVLFSNHSVLRDPPFSRMDLISSRNLLIYLRRGLQKDVFQIFHYALLPEGYLFLGNAESAEMVPRLFQTVDKRYGLYRALPWQGEQPPVPTLPLSVFSRRSEQPVPQWSDRRQLARGATVRATTGVHLELLEKTAPPSIVVDEAFQIVHYSPTAGRYLQYPGGAVTNDLLAVVRPELEVELRAALFQVFEQNKPVFSSPLSVQLEGGRVPSHRLIVAVRPHQPDPDQMAAAVETDTGEVDSPAAPRLALIFFLEDQVTAPEEFSAPAASSEGEGGREEGEVAIGQTETDEEVQRLRARLQTISERYESANEELKVANAELQSINEEYRSATEELETSKEELRSLNEELQTVNTELKNKLEEVSRAHGDLENLMAATEIATLFLDRELRIQRYTASTAELFNVMPGDRGRPLGHLTNRLQYGGLTEDARQVLETLVPVEREVQDVEGRWFMAQLRPYRTLNDRIDGVVLTFVDIGDLKETESALRAEKEFSIKIVDTVREGLLVLEPDLTVEFANESFYEMFEVREVETVGSYIYNLGNGQWDIPELRTLLEEILPERKVFNGYRVVHTFEQVGYRVMLLNARRLDHIDKILLAIEDVTEKEQYEAELRARQRELAALNETLEQRVARRTSQVEKLARELTMAEHEERGRIAQVLHDDLQQQLYALQMQLTFLRAETTPAAEAEIAEMEEALQTAIQTARQLSVDLSPPILEGEGLTEGIGWLANLMEERHRLQVEVEAADSFVIPDVDRRVLLFQAVRELLFNVVKHARTPEATVRLQVVDEPEQERVYRIDVVDQGVGFDPEVVLGPEAKPNGRGLLHIRQRLEMIGGRLEVESVPDDGTRMTIVVHLHGEAVDSHTPAPDQDE
ncbi:MAG: chemotaxis protein CheB [Candidatus Promineifilaceae bacterium]|nr:chemotaxis protein CheB [Candidatus Promineifilaceae bacterium]